MTGVVTQAEQEAIERDEPVDGEHAVTPLELFFDLVFVFALTQVTAAMAAEPTFTGVGKGLLVLASVWWVWVGYAWLTNVIEPEETLVRLAIFAAMGALFLVALAVPQAFGGDALLFALALTAVRTLHIVLFALAPNGADIRVALRSFAPRAMLAMVLLIVASQTDGTVQGALWVVALTVDLTSAAGRRQLESWRVYPEHFAERHGLIFLIAIGESIVAVGVGASEQALTAGPILGCALGLVIAVALWWSYFDVVAVVAARVLGRTAEGYERNKMARDSYSWLHLPMVAGVVLVALGLKKAVGSYDEDLKLVPALALCAGPALYLLAHVAFRLRNVRTWSPRRVIAAGLCLAVTPVAATQPALAAVALLATVLAGLIVYETVRFADVRKQVRAKPVD